MIVLRTELSTNPSWDRGKLLLGQAQVRVVASDVRHCGTELSVNASLRTASRTFTYLPEQRSRLGVSAVRFVACSMRNAERELFPGCFLRLVSNCVQAKCGDNDGAAVTFLDVRRHERSHLCAWPASL